MILLIIQLFYNNRTGLQLEEPEEFMVSLPQSIRVSVLMDLPQNALLR